MYIYIYIKNIYIYIYINSRSSSSSSSNSSSSSSSTQRVGLWTGWNTHTFEHHRYIVKHYTLEQPMFQKTHQKQEPIKQTRNQTKPWEQTMKGTYKNTNHMWTANQING